MQCGVVAGHTIFDDHGIVIIEQCVPCCRLDASFGGASGDHDSFDAVTPEKHIQISSPERAGPVLFDDHLVSSWREFGYPVCTLRSLNGVSKWLRLPQKPLANQEIKPHLGRGLAFEVRQHRMPDVHDRHFAISRNTGQRSQPLDHGWEHAEIASEGRKNSVWRDEVTLHVDNQQSGVCR